MKTTRKFNRKPVNASTEYDLMRKVRESELRGWVLKGYGQHSNGCWYGVMEKESKKVT